MKDHYGKKNKLELVDMVEPGSECQLMKEMPLHLFIGLFERTDGDPCEGCYYKNDCSFLTKKGIEEKQRKKANFGKVGFKTNEIAAEKGISKRQASKMKREEVDYEYNRT